MGQPAAKEGDQVVAIDVHVIMVPSPSGLVPTPIPHPFSGRLDGALSSNVYIEGKPAATVDSTASNQPPHTPIGGSFQSPPSDTSTVKRGSTKVFINRKAAARAGDIAETCNDPSDLPSGAILASGSVFIG
jgi:uncharacterized Zn-binding protein involved in type VI secretion